MKTIISYLLVTALATTLGLTSLVNWAFRGSLGEQPVVLLLGDCRDVFSQTTLAGVQAAQKEFDPQASIQLRTIGCEQSAPLDPSELRRELLNTISSSNVVAIITANTSGQVDSVLHVGRQFRIPVLVTVATENGLVARFEETTFRLLPPNSRQAETVTAWCNSIDNETGLAVLHEDTAYGSDLLQQVEDVRGATGFTPFELGHTTDVVGVLSYGTQARAGSWALIAYQSRAKEVLSKKIHMGIAGPLLISDSAYGDWLRRLPPEHRHDVHLCFPKLFDNPASSPERSASERRDQLIGYAPFGYDAFAIIVAAMHDVKKTGGPKCSLLHHIRDAAERTSEDGKTMQAYLFDDTGENRLATFQVYSLKDGDVP